MLDECESISTLVTQHWDMKKIAVPRWGDIVHVLKAILLFIPNLIHDLVVPPEEGDEGSHMMTWEFGQAVKHMPQLLRSLAFKTRTLEEQLHQVCN